MSAGPAERVSVVVTVRDEAASVESFLAGLLSQTEAADEIVVVDGGSEDDTVERVRAIAAGTVPPVRLLEAPGANISRGRNVAIDRAGGALIAVTDAGTIPEPDWLERLVAPLRSDPDLAVASGFFRPRGETLFERTLAIVITPQLPEIDPARFLPSSRSVAFRKHWWERVGGYPEWLSHCEDLVFDLGLKRAGARFAFAPQAIVGWAARPSLRAFARQYFNYARGDGRAGLWPRRHAIRYAAYAAGTLLVGLAATGRWWALAPLAAGAAAYLSKFARRLIRIPPSPRRGERLVAWILMPIIVVVGDLAKMAGYPVGVSERATADPGRRDGSASAGELREGAE